MSLVLAQTRSDRLPAYAVFAALLSCAGLPLYIHAPKFYVDTYGVGLGALGAVLFALRLIDVVQDPLFGRLAERWRAYRGLSVSVAVILMAIGIVGLFAIIPPISPLTWFGLMLVLVFSGFSFLTITFYAQGVQKAGHLEIGGHLRLARWRETGAILGICAAAIAPTVLAGTLDRPFAGFALGFVALAGGAWILMRPEWGAEGLPRSQGFSTIWRDPIARRLLFVAFVNAAPAAITSTLFLFFVESRLNAPRAEGPLLLLFFLSAAIAAPVWSRLAERYGARRILICAMTLNIAAFGWVLTLGPGDIFAFSVICMASGAALGADMTLLPAMFARRLADISPAATEGFGLWSFMSKMTLAFAAVMVLPALDFAGFQAGSENSDETLRTLTLLYAAVPCALKLFAVALLLTLKLEERR